MKINQIVDIINSTINKDREKAGLDSIKLILKKTVLPHSTMKVYKIFTYELYSINGKDKKLILTLSSTQKASSNNLVKIEESQDLEATRAIIDHIIHNYNTISYECNNTN